MKTWPVTKITIVAIMLALLLSIAGCASWNLGSTEVTYKDLGYKSNKNQEGFKSETEFFENGQLKRAKVETTAVTPEAAIKASADAQLKALELADRLTALLEKMAITGATKVPIGR